MNPNYYSSAGIQISMYRFTDIHYDSTTGTDAVGAGNIWDDVYDALMPYDVNVVGGRVSGIGVAGYTLGGGTHRLPSPITLLRQEHLRLLVADEPVWPHYRYRPCV